MQLRRAAAAIALSFALIVCSTHAPANEFTAQGDFWAARDAQTPSLNAPLIRIGIWDSGVDLGLFAGRIALDKEGRPLVRGYDPFKMRQDTPMAVLSTAMNDKRDEMNRALLAFDDIDSKVASPAAAQMTAKLDSLSKEEKAAFLSDVGLWSGYVHGTAVADIALANHPRAEIVVARMEWWHGSPPIPCWTRELADREAESIRDLLNFLVESDVRVVNMSWGRFETSYLRNLEECAPAMHIDERRALARYTVDAIREVLRAGMAAAPKVLFVGAAGNAGTSLDAANPATRFSLPNFLLVGAVDRSGAIADYTNIGPEVTIYANGDRVPARLPGGQASFPTGTSMATPNVANVAAKMLAVNPRLTGAQLRTLLEQTGDTNATGQRLIHPARAVEAARTTKTH
jgi:hypothetical protein